MPAPKNLFLYILFLSSLSYAQKSNYDFIKAETESRKLVFSNPDAAFVIIKKTLAQGYVNDSITGNTYNLYGLYHAMKGNPDSSIYYYKKAINYLDKYRKLKVGVLINLSAGYRHKGEYDNSIKVLTQTLKEYNKEEDNKARAMMYGELASNYNYKLEYKTSINYLLKAMDIFKKENDTLKLPPIKQKLANTYLNMENFEFAIDMYKECLREFKALKQEKNYYLTLINMGEAQLQLKLMDDARTTLTEAATGMEKFGDVEILGITYAKLGSLEFKQNNYTKSVTSYQKAIDHLLKRKSSRLIRIGGEYINILNSGKDYTKALALIKQIESLKINNGDNIEDRMIYQSAIADTYSATSNAEMAIASYKNAASLKDSIAQFDKKNKVEEIQAKYQTEKQRDHNIALNKHNQLLKEKIKTEKMLLVLYFAIAAIIIVMILLLLKGARLKNHLQAEKLKTIEAETELLKQQHSYEKELNNSQQEIIKEKQRELTSFALRMANYQDNVTDLINKIDNKQVVKLGDVKKELNLLIKQKDYWKQFEIRFNRVHPKFNDALLENHPNLTKNDLEFCSLLKLNLSNKEIASLLQISHESVITKKYRIKKKMSISDDAEFEKILTSL